MHSSFPQMTMTVLDAVGSLVFALSGAVLAIEKRFDLFGVLFLSFITAVTGGITRDLLVGSVPPVAIASWRPLAIAVVGGLLTFYVYPAIQSYRRPVLLLDAVGLALFAVTGTQKAINYGIDPVMAATLGMISGIGGGMARDILAGDVPFVLRADLYALAALAAGGIVSLGYELGSPSLYPLILGFAACISLRIMAIYRGWHAPVARWNGDSSKAGADK
jgi:uncharacterized membrane protein YeiH